MRWNATCALATSPIVALTANTMQEDINECLVAGCDDFVSKPVDRKHFCETLGKYLQNTNKQGFDSTPIHSSLLKEEPEFFDLVKNFVTQLPIMIQEMRDSFTNKDWNILKGIAHDLKSLGGGHGFPVITQLASNIEFSLAKHNYMEVNELFDELESIHTRISLDEMSIT